MSLWQFLPRAKYIVVILIWFLAQFLPLQIGLEISHYNQDSAVLSALTTYAATFSGLDRAITGGSWPVHTQLFDFPALPSLGQEAQKATQVPQDYQYGFNGNDYLYWSDGTAFCIYGKQASSFSHANNSSSTCKPASAVGVETSGSNTFYGDASTVKNYTLVVGGTILAPGKTPTIPANLNASYLTEIAVGSVPSDSTHYRYSFSVIVASKYPDYAPRAPISEIIITPFDDPSTNITVPEGWTTSLDERGIHFKAKDVAHFIPLGGSLDGFSLINLAPSAHPARTVSIWTVTSNNVQSWDGAILVEDGKVKTN